MTTQFQYRIKEAQELVKNKCVKRYSITESVIRWLVVGKLRNYLVFIDPPWCRCYDFQRNFLKNSYLKCKHTLAVEIAQKDQNYQKFYLDNNEYRFIRDELIN